MESPVDDRLLREAETYRFRFTCQDCAYFDVAVSACSHGYPHEAHANSDLRARRLVVFCKAFELV